MTLIKRYLMVALFLVSVPVFVARHGDIEYSTLVYIAATIMWLMIRDRITHGAPLETETAKIDRMEKVLLIATGIGMILLPLVALYSPFLDFALYQTTVIALLAGVIVVVPGLYVFYRSHIDLGAYWSPTLELRKGHELVKTGVYRHVRHPMYTAIFLICIAQALLLQNWLAGIAGLLAFSTLYVLRVQREEQLMIEKFGDDYHAYAERTPRIVPTLRPRR